jgi:hypothetical protein
MTTETPYIQDKANKYNKTESEVITINYIQKQLKKIGLSCNDDKVHILDNNINTYNFGHWRTKI